MNRVLIIGALAFSLMSCTSPKSDQSEPGQVKAPDVMGPVQVPEAAQGQTVVVTLSNGSEIQLQRYGDKYLFLVEGTFESESFNRLQASIANKPTQERRLILDQEVNKIFSALKLKAAAIEMDSVPSVGYFRFLMPYEPNLFESISKLQLGRSIIVEPVLFDRNAIKNIRKLAPNNQELPLRQDGRSSDSGYAGLKSIRVPEFIQIAEKMIGSGAAVNGSTIKVGIVDTGITLNHPAFFSEDGSSRILEIKDTTNEGAIYINPGASMTVVVPESSPEEDLIIQAQVLVTPKLPALPSADAFSEIKDLRVKADPELRKILLNPSSGAKLGFLLEDSLQASGEEVDFNRNGKLDDKLPVIYVPASGNEPETVYFDPSGTADFRGATAITDFNKGGKTILVSAEKIGFAFRKAKLATADGKSSQEVNVINFVGFDPGNHGTHVAGITLAKKMLANSQGSTLARGVAPEAKLYFNRVCSNNNGCGGSKGIAELAESDVDVINMSIGGLSIYNDGYGVQETLINRLVAQKNIVFMISAGNSGPGKQTVGSPSTARLSLSIGATASQSMIERQYQWPGLGSSVLSDDFMLFFSSRGPTAAGGFKPNLSAPGTQLSSIQLNASANARAGLDVYWGTSMAAPTATGAFALLLDAIRKYNLNHPDKALPTNALVLRNVLIESARPFDVTMKDTTTGLTTSGQYTWADQGTGMVDLVKAWDLLFALRGNNPKSSVQFDGKDIELDYQVLASETNANGLAYNGTEGESGKPKFAAGLYLDFNSTSSLKKAFVARRIPENLQTVPQAGELYRQLVTTSDRFVLRTVIYGSDVEWLKAGVRDELDCTNSQTANLEVIGEGVVVQLDPNGKGTLNSLATSVLNVCVNQALSQKLSPGDHGALIYAYRTDGRVTSPVASFIVPVYMNVPHRVLQGSTSYQAEDMVSSFQVDRHYVQVPKGTSVVVLNLEVPEYKGECYGVELMAYEGSNVKKFVASRTAARISNCNSDGQPTTTGRTLQAIKVNPEPGLWDVHIFGQYKFKQSKYKLRVDYITGSSDKNSIAGGLDALKGRLTWNIASSSVDVAPDSLFSSFVLNGLSSSTKMKVAQDSTLPIPNVNGILRSYSSSIKKVAITTGESKGNDIDLTVLECPFDATSESDSRCQSAYSSGGSTDIEKVEFVPKAESKYVALISGYDIKNNGGEFVSEELLTFEAEYGLLEISGTAPSFAVNYDFPVSQSSLLNSDLFKSGAYSATGYLSIRTKDLTVLSEIPVKVK